MTLLGHGVRVVSHELAAEERGRAALDSEREGNNGGFYVALGGVATNFRREIKPLEKVECWTRVLSWDGKWLYVVGHFVRAGSVRVGGRVLGEGGWAGWANKGWWRRGGEEAEKGEGEGEKLPVVYASAIAKYVCKKGRVTVPPERVLRASKLLPVRPGEEVGKEEVVAVEGKGEGEGMNGNGDGDGVAVDGVAAMPAAEAVLDSVTPEKGEEVMGAPVLSADDGEGVWDWARVEKERLRGMRIAQVYSDLDGLSAEAPEHGSMVLGRS